MPRVRKGASRRRKHKRVLKEARGQRGAGGRSYRSAITAKLRAGQYAYRDRRTRKRDFRGLWIARLSAACRERGTNYSTFINGLKRANVRLNRKMLSEVAVSDAKMFDKLVALANNAPT